METQLRGALRNKQTAQELGLIPEGVPLQPRYRNRVYQGRIAFCGCHRLVGHGIPLGHAVFHSVRSPKSNNLESFSIL